MTDRATSELGNTYGRLTVVSRAKNSGGHARWLCICECGNNAVVLGYNLRNERSRSCGCVRTIHGMEGSPTYKSWSSMIRRCTKPAENCYHNYGGRGISVCERWLESPLNFLNDMGERPDGHSIDRIDNNGNYEPDNCRWATRKEQANNRR